MTVYKGFDISGYPGDTAMSDFWTNTPFSFTGFYLAPAPNHSDTGWMNKKSYLSGLGYGFLPIYVGLQTGDSNLTYSQGQTDASNAASLASTAGFNTLNNVIYLDVEGGGGTLSTEMINYVDGWIDYIVNSTIYMPGIYCSYENADTIKNSSTNAGNLNNIRYWVAGTNNSPGCTTAIGSSTPSDSGTTYASSWQYALSPYGPSQCTTSTCCEQTWNGTSLWVDLDMSNYSDPSVG